MKRSRSIPTTTTFRWEHHFKGTDVAIKLTPFYRWGTDQLYETPNLPSLGVSPSFNAGTLRVDGLELLLTKGDFTKNGFSGTFSYTYTNAAEKWSDYLNSTVGPVRRPTIKTSRSSTR